MAGEKFAVRIDVHGGAVDGDGYLTESNGGQPHRAPTVRDVAREVDKRHVRLHPIHEDTPAPDCQSPAFQGAEVGGGAKRGHHVLATRRSHLFALRVDDADFVQAAAATDVGDDMRHPDLGSGLA